LQTGSSAHGKDRYDTIGIKGKGEIGMEVKITGSGEIPSFFGRTLYDGERKAMFFNWTASGFALRFYGTRLAMDVTAFTEDFPGEAKNLPWVTVLLDDETEPLRRIRLEEGRKAYELFTAAQAAEHTLRVVKHTENSKGRVGLHTLLVEGELRPYTLPVKRWKLEFVGDSITCGYGNAMAADAPMFINDLEEGLFAYPAITAQLLDAAYQSVCISGIPLCPPADPDFKLRLPGMPDFTPPPRAMETYYQYTDRNHQEAMGQKDEFTLWDFRRFRPDAVVINLGTNDAFRLSVSGCMPAEETHFCKRYTAFLQEVRRLNGPHPLLACTLGPMNYYLYDTLEKAVNAYRTETGDTRVFCMKFGAIDPWGEGFGGLTHPNLKTHARMGRELAAALRPWLEQEA